MRILVIDDHELTIELMQLTLTSFGHSVLTATSVDRALALVAAGKPDVVLSDLTFSAAEGQDGSDSQDGHALARALRSDPTNADVGLLAITGVSSPAEHRAALASGFDGIVVKPFEVGALIEQIEALGAPRSGTGPAD